jgi:AcrR family transcriptional regulator
MGKKADKTSQAQKILQTAFHCLSRKGYANVSMRDIADEAGVALSQLHYYYKSKEGFIIEL